MDSEWKPVPAWISTEHEVSIDGQVRRTVPADRGRGQRGGAQWGAGKILSQSVSKKGYYSVCINGRTYRVHRIVCEAFHGPAPEESCLVRHLDDVKGNNHADNLAWGDPQENYHDAVRNGTMKPVPQRFCRDAAKSMRDLGMTFREIGAALGVSHVAVILGLKAEQVQY